jgi:hypothetical protein
MNNDPAMYVPPVIQLIAIVIFLRYKNLHLVKARSL